MDSQYLKKKFKNHKLHQKNPIYLPFKWLKMGFIEIVLLKIYFLFL
jgi:hypothetical protein|tara:strand:- start:3780 stop:3917 length:138 start_codon:yes stop_codon:yes gene_type:complete